MTGGGEGGARDVIAGALNEPPGYALIVAGEILAALAAAGFVLSPPPPPLVWVPLAERWPEGKQQVWLSRRREGGEWTKTVLGKCGPLGCTFEPGELGGIGFIDRRQPRSWSWVPASVPEPPEETNGEGA